MKHLLVLALASLLLAGCATRSSHVLRRGKLIERPSAPLVSAPAAKPAPAASPKAATAPAAPSSPATPAASVVVSAPVSAPVVVAIPAAPPPASTATETPPAVFEAPFVASRSGATVRLRWTLPGTASGYRAIEIMRNNRVQAAGRGRVRAVRAELTSLEDTLPDATANYWYWLKITHVDGTVQNLGPFAATES